MSNVVGWTMCDLHLADVYNEFLYRIRCVCPDFDPALCDTFTTGEDCFLKS